MYSHASDLSCPKCGSVDRVNAASSYPEKFQLPRQSARETLSVPFGAFILVYLLASLQFLAHGFYGHLASWPSALSAMNDLLPKPVLSAAIGGIILLVALDGLTRAFLLRTGRAAALDSQLYRELDAGPSSVAADVIPVGVASFGWAVFLGFRSVDSWLAMATARSLAGPDWVPLAVQAFLAGGLVTLAGLPLMAFVMTQVTSLWADYGTFGKGEASFGHFARVLAYPYIMLPVGMGLALISGMQLLTALAICWFLAAIFVAARHTVKQNIELALPVALLGAVPAILAFFVVTLQTQSSVVKSNWDSFRSQTSTLPDLERVWLIGTIALAGLLILIALLALNFTRRNQARMELARQQVVTHWRSLLYCERCDGVHLPNQKEFVPASQMDRLLLP